MESAQESRWTGLKELTPAWQEIETAARVVPPEALPQFLANLEKVRLIAFCRLVAPVPTPERDELVGIEEAARRLGMSTAYLYRHHAQLPFARHIGRKLLFSSAGIDRFIGARR